MGSCDRQIMKHKFKDWKKETKNKKKDMKLRYIMLQRLKDELDYKERLYNKWLNINFNLIDDF